MTAPNKRELLVNAKTPLQPVQLAKPLPNAVRTFVEACLKPGEYGSYQSTKDDGETPTPPSSYTMERDNLAEQPEQELNPNGYGLYVRVNPMKASGSTADEVAEYRQVLLECDDAPLELQWAAAVASGLPIVTMVHSGGKSLHLIVRVDAGQDLELYKQRAKTAKACLEQYEGVTVVNNVQDPIILTRFGGARRGDKRQDLLAVNIGARSWEEYEAKHKANAETKASVLSQEQQEDKPEPSYGKSTTYCPKQGGKLTIASTLDFDKINADLLSNYFEILQRWLPNGRKIGPDWCVGSLAGEPGQSLKIHIGEGFWIDFATGEKGGDPVSLYAAIHNLSQGEAAKQLSGYIAPPTSKRQPKKKVAVVDDDGFKPVTNPPEDCIAAPVKGTAYYYHTKNGCVSFCIDRFEKPDGKKSFTPWTLWENCSGPTYEMEWRAKALTTPRPVYNLHKLTDMPSACVVVVEGEKCAEALQLILPEFVVTTWAGGANATGKTDFEPLRGRNLIFWPDNDDPGKKAMAGLVALYGGKLVVIPDGKPEKWDCADAIAEGWGRAEILELWGNATLHRAQETDLTAQIKKSLTEPTKATPLDPCELESDSMEPPIPDHDTELQNDIIIPGGAQSITSTAQKIVKCMTGKYYYGRGVELLCANLGVNGAELVPISDKKLCSEVEKIGNPVIWAKKKIDGKVIPNVFILVRTIMGAGVAATLLPAVVEGLPKIRGIVNFPRIRSDGTIQEEEYDAETGLLCLNFCKPDDIPLPEAIKIISELLGDFNPASGADQSRMVAALILPAIRFGPWANQSFPFPIIQVQADNSQTGKGYFVELWGSIYGSPVTKVTQGDGRGVGGFEEKIHTALSTGTPFVCLDNFRGSINSTFLESFVTAGGPVPLRIVGRNSSCDSRGHLFCLTDNGITATRDFLNRTLSLSLRKQPPGYSFCRWENGGPTGDLHTHIRANRSRVLGAIYSVLREWIKQSMPIKQTTHDLRHVVGALDWIIQELFKLPSIMDGHEAMRDRQASPLLAWLLEIAKAAGVGEYSATELLEMAEEHGIDLPDSLARRTDADGPKKQLGLLLKKEFREREKIDLGAGWKAARATKTVNYAHSEKDVPVYRFSFE